METGLASAAPQENPILRQVVAGFVAGFVAVLLFHQGMATILNAAHFGTIREFPTGLTHPFGVPKIWSLAFWGGIWGIVLALIFLRFPQGAGYWIGALVFGAIAPSLVAWLVVGAVSSDSPETPAVRSSLLWPGVALAILAAIGLFGGFRFDYLAGRKR